MFQVEVVWNREFEFVSYGGPWQTLNAAIAFARLVENGGDGARVKKTRVVDQNGKIVWAYGKKVSQG